MIAFLVPWILGFLVVLPVVWWLLRLTPPAPRKVIFPAIALLRDLPLRKETPARSPWWIVILRLIIVALIICAFAEPVFNPQAPLPGHDAVLIAIDNDWAAARDWDARRTLLHDLIAKAAREDRPVILLPTAPPPSGNPLHIIGPLAAEAASAEAGRILPQPWPSDWAAAQKLLAGAHSNEIAYSYWLASGLGGSEAKNFYGALKTFSALQDPQVFSDTASSPIYLLAPPKNEDVSFSVWRTEGDTPSHIVLLAKTLDGRVLTRIPADFSAGQMQAQAAFDLPLDVHNQTARIEIEGRRTAATTVLLDQDWQRHLVGIVGDQNEAAQQTLLSGIFYLDRALKPFADIHIGTLTNLLAEDPSVVIATDQTVLSDNGVARLSEWIKRGGVFVRFAGERLAVTQNPRDMELLPVSLRTGDRALGGIMSWAMPQKMHEFQRTSPFYGLQIPPDVTVNRQVLAEPSGDLPQRTWAALEDGTPLVTARSIGRGISVLFHVPAQTDWSNLPLSGLFVDMLRRLVNMSHNGNAVRVANFSQLAPVRQLDGFGDEALPSSAALPLEGERSKIEPSPQHPPGIYGNETTKRAFNLGEALAPPMALTEIPLESFYRAKNENDLKPALLAIAFVLLLIDFLISLRMRGLVNWPRISLRKFSLLPILMTLVVVHPAAAMSDKDAIQLTSKTYLGYVETGDLSTDKVSEEGLLGLARILQSRTSLDQVGVAGVDLEQDDLAFFPLLYWPLTDAAAPLSKEAVQHVNDYLHHGGMILFDSAAEGAANDIQRKLAGVEIPPLVPIPPDHVLHRSFYLLDAFPGREESGELWLEPSDLSSYDGVATVLAGNDDWAAAWATDDHGRPLFACTPGGEIQREQAYRFGVNLVMYALTGNYKSDQLHAQALLERLGR